jgi:hypothetical protein
MTHQELVFLSAKWLERDHQCPLVFQEVKTVAGEIPDVIGFFDGGDSVLIECKISRADLASDKHKSYRFYPEDGMGDYRFIATTSDVWGYYGAKLPENWGLLIVSNNGFQVEIEPERFESANKRGEGCLLVAAIRQMGLVISPTWEKQIAKKTKPSYFGGYKVYPMRNSEITRFDERMAQLEKMLEEKHRIEEEERIAYLAALDFRRKQDLEWREALADNYNRDFPYDDGEPRSVSVM